MSCDERTCVCNKDDVRCVIPEANDAVVEFWAPELKKAKSYWQIGTSHVSRVKISALVEDEVDICTEEATTIPGTPSENFEPVETLGTVIIHVFSNFHIEAHVTRSKNVAPFVVDGILGLDVIKAGRWNYDAKRHILRRHCDPKFCIPALPGISFIPDYVDKLQDRLNETSIAREQWSTASRRLKDARSLLPPEVSNDERLAVVDVLDDFTDCLYLPGDRLKATNLFQYPIKTKGIEPIYIRQPDHSQNRWDQIELLVNDLLRQGIVRESTSPYNFPIGLIEKKADCRGNVHWRIAIDFYELNNRSEQESFPIPSIVDAVDQLHGSKYFSVLDLASASYQMALEPQDRRKTAFTTRSGRYEFLRVPIHLKNVSQYTQRLMNRVFEGMRDYVFVCHDDILVHTPTFAEHEVKVRKVLSRIRRHGLKLQPSKCRLFRSEVMYLGFLITDEGLRPDPEKIDYLKNHGRPQTAEELRRFLGLLSVHKRFFSNYAGRAKPMWDMLKRPEFRWTAEANDSFNNFQSSLRQDLLLSYPDWNQPFIVKTCSTENGIYAGLMQQQSSHHDNVIAWASRTYIPSETRLDIDEQECLASVFGLDTFRRYVQHTTSLDELARSLSLND